MRNSGVDNHKHLVLVFLIFIKYRLRDVFKLDDERIWVDNVVVTYDYLEVPFRFLFFFVLIIDFENLAFFKVFLIVDEIPNAKYLGLIIVIRIGWALLTLFVKLLYNLIIQKVQTLFLNLYLWSCLFQKWATKNKPFQFIGKW